MGQLKDIREQQHVVLSEETICNVFTAHRGKSREDRVSPYALYVQGSNTIHQAVPSIINAAFTRCRSASNIVFKTPDTSLPVYNQQNMNYRRALKDTRVRVIVQIG